MSIQDTMVAKLDELGNSIDEKIEGATKAQSDNLHNELDSFKKNEIQGMVEQFNELSEDVVKMQTQLDSVETGMNRKSGEVAEKNWIGSFVDQIKNTEGFAQQVRTNKGIEFQVPMFSTKAIVDGANNFAEGTVISNRVVAPDYQPGIVFDPTRPAHVREFLPQGTTTSDVVRYVRESAYTDGSGMKVESASAGTTEFTLSVEDAPVRTIASHVRLSQEMLDDVEGISSYISQRLPAKLRSAEDGFLLFGSDAPTFEGITEASTAYVDELADANVNRFDILIKAIQQVRQDEYMASAIMLHPDDYYNMLLIKDSEGEYLLPDIYRFGAEVPTIAGVPVIANTAMTTDKFLVGDFNMGVQLFDRQQSSIRFYEQDQDNAVKGVVTVVASERIAMPVYRPNAFVFGDFGDALTDGAS